MSAAADLRSEISQLQMNIESSMGVNTYNATSEESVVDGTTESGAGMVMCQSSSGTSSSEATNTVTSASGSQVDSVDSSDLVEPGSLGLHNHTTASEDISSTDHADNGFSSNRYTLLETEDDLEVSVSLHCFIHMLYNKKNLPYSLQFDQLNAGTPKIKKVPVSIKTLL